MSTVRYEFSKIAQFSVESSRFSVPEILREIDYGVLKVPFLQF